jgi:para-aminobenzoate synthetase component 1
MIVDLVRNDLAKIAEKKSVRVDELCVLNTFKTLHHLISTVSCEIDEEKTVSELLKALFPMGSMTGAPKVSVMKLIDSFESFKRGVFSGSIGLIEPNGDFDFNVVIRTIVYTKANKIMTCSVGSAITIASNPEKEYEECFVKLNRLISF